MKLVVAAADERYERTVQLLYLGGVLHENADITSEFERWVRLMQVRLKRFGAELYMMVAPLSINVGEVKADVIETLLY